MEITPKASYIIIGVITFFIIAAIVSQILMFVIYSNKSSNSDGGKVSIGSSCVKGVNQTQDGLGFKDNFRGWYDVTNCGLKQSYCRWQGDDGNKNENPAVSTTSGTNIWACTSPTGEFNPQATWNFTIADKSRTEELFQSV
jgi:hypothetical protein